MCGPSELTSGCRCQLCADLEYEGDHRNARRDCADGLRDISGDRRKAILAVCVVQTNQVLCLNLVTNAIVTWNTVYMNAAIERLRAEGRIGRDIDLGHLSPALYGHVNPYGKYRFEIEGRAPNLRPLRSPGNDA